jgi:hypothetical protein
MALATYWKQFSKDTLAIDERIGLARQSLSSNSAGQRRYSVIFPLRPEKTVVIETRAPEGLCARIFDAVLGRGYGEIGRHARFRFWCRKAWEFKSLYPHQFAESVGEGRKRLAAA